MLLRLFRKKPTAPIPTESTAPIYSSANHDTYLSDEQTVAFNKNVNAFNSVVIPKVAKNYKRYGIVVAYRYICWYSKKERKRLYREMANAMRYHHKSSGANVCFGYNNALVAFYLTPSKNFAQTTKRNLIEATKGYGGEYILNEYRFFPIVK